MKTIFTILAFIPILLNAQQTLNKTMVHDGVTRSYIVYIPAVYNGSEPVPLMFNFHGYTMTANDQMIWGGNMRPLADTAGFILIYPQGTVLPGGSTHWNVGSWTANSPADDIGFTDAMIDSMSANYNIDMNRIYSCGYSNGGYFSFVLACQLSSKIAAIGSVGGTMSTETYNSCNPSHPMPVVTIHGTSDAVVSYNGGNPFNSQSLSNVNAYWSAHNNTSTTPIVNNLPDINSSDNSTVELSAYREGDNCTSVEHYKVIAGGHDWPGSWGNMDISASAVIWNFVSKYDLNGLIGCQATSNNEENISSKKISVYPNPADHFVTVETDFGPPQEYQIYSITGALILQDRMDSNSERINLSSLIPGVYLLSIGEQAIKLVKRP